MNTLTQRRQLRTRLLVAGLNTAITFIAISIVCVALYVLAARQLLQLLPERKEAVADWLALHLDMNVAIDGIDAEMRFLTPVVRLRGVHINAKGVDAVAAASPALDIDRIELELATFATLLSRQPVLDLLRVDGLSLTVEETADGHFRVKGMPFRVNDPDADRKLRQALQVVYAQRDIVVERSRIVVDSERLPMSEFSGIRLHMHNDGETHAMSGAAWVLGQGRLPLGFVMQFSGEPVRPADIVADIYLHVFPSSLEGWLPRRNAGEVWVDALTGGGEAWLKLAGGKVDDVRGRVQVDTLSVSRDDGRKVEGILDASARFHWHGVADDWTLALGALDFRRQGRAWPEADIALAYKASDDAGISWRARVSRSSVEMLAGLATLLPAEHAASVARLGRLAPQGQLADTRVDWAQSPDGVADWIASTQFLRVGWNADGGMPGVRGLSGAIDAAPAAGTLVLRAQDAQLALPTVFAQPVNIGTATLALGWQYNESGWRIRSDRFTLQNPDARASGLFTLEIPVGPDAQPRLQLLGMVEDGKAVATPRYLPSSISPELRNWLTNGLRDGHLARGTFLVDGPLRHDAASRANPRTFQMRFVGDGLTVAFLPKWPELRQADVDAWIDGADADIRSHGGRLLDSAVGDVHVTVNGDTAGHSTLGVDTRVDGDLADLFTLFRDTPLRNEVPSEFSRWSGNGHLQARVGVSTPLGRTDDLAGIAAHTRVTAGGTISGGALVSAVHDLVIDDVSGEMKYDTVDGFSGKNLRGNSMGTVLAGYARTQPENGRQVTSVDLKGRMRMQAVSAWLKVPALDVLKGDADAALTLRFAPGEDSRLEVRSDLRGIASTAPAPLSKSADVAVDSRFSWVLGSDQPRMTLTYGRAMSADIQTVNGVPLRGAIALGAAKLPAMPDTNGLVVEGATSTLSINEWVAFLRKLANVAEDPAAKPRVDTVLSRAVAGVAALGDRVNRVNVSVGHLDAGSFGMDDVSLKILRADDGISLALVSREVDAALGVPAGYRVGDTRPLALTINHLALAESVGRAGAPILLPTDVPALTIHADNLKVGAEDYGTWSLDAEPETNGVALRNVQGKWRAMDIRGYGEWIVADGKQSTNFQGAATAADVASVSEALGFEPNLSSSQFRIDIQSLTWPGRPDAIDLDTATASLRLDLRGGRFVTEARKTQALRAFGVFNVKTWQRRMKLDFTDIYKRGVAFDTLTGDLALNAGRLSTAKLVAKGPSAQFELSGATDLDAHAVDARLNVTLPVNSNLYVGCLAGLAACAGIVAFEQLWGDRLEKLTTLRYDVRGTWEDPQIQQIEGGQASRKSPDGG